ncbi:sterol desaturase family protein [Aquisediminimonas profunda]|uniref:sterol desaturase family protein n=1 Tax=Aquisediminimonas profunda TaxID=1550733 RepID=UPI001C62C56D|nr:sterol desaturase family protein [Aquisediminimonas profunda]
MTVDTLVTIALPVLFLLMMALECLIGTGRVMPDVRGWRWIGIAAFLVTFACNGLMPMVLLPLLPKVTLLDLGSLGLWAAIPVVILTTFFTYWTHRIQHRFDVLWRLGHQLHHGVARVDIASAMLFHPVDVAVQVTMTLLAGLLLGATPEAASVAGGLGFFIALFQHWNVATPRWMGLIIQRPEAHMLHHERDVHARNFGDMPIWDMIFGTYANPLRADVPVGFAPEAMRRWLAMIAFVDVNKGSGRDRL